MKRWSKWIVLICILIFGMNMNVYAAEDENESGSEEQASVIEEDIVDEVDQYVDGIYNVSPNARASMVGIIRLSQAGTKLQANYSTTYTSTVDKIGVKNIKLEYKSSLGLWYTILTFDDRYRTNKSSYSGSFTCNGVVGRTYRLKATHYIINGSYSESRNNVTGTLTF